MAKAAAAAEVQAPAIKESEPSKGSKTVTVMCKTPNGLVLRLFRMEDYSVPIPAGGSRNEKRAVQDGDAVVVNGYAAPAGMTPWHKQPVEGGYAMTRNVDRVFWEKWLSQNQDLDAVKNKLIFAVPNRDAAVDQANEQEKVWDGLQPLEQQDDPRNPKPMNRSVKGIETASRG
jgi:hypothetical protein